MEMGFIASFIIIIIFLSVFAYFFVFKSKVLVMDSIKTMIDNNRLDEAIEKLLKILSKEKNNGRAHYYLGIAFDKKGDINAAIAEYNMALRNAGFVSESEQLYIHTRLADLYFQLQKFDEALGEYLFLSKKFPNDPYFLTQVGEIFFEKKSFGNAASYYKKALQLDDKNPIAHYNIGRIYYISKLYRDAERHFLRCIDLQNNFYDAAYYLGLIYQQFGKTKLAIDYFSKGVYSTKFKGQSLYQIASILHATKDYNNAIKFYLKAITNIKENELLLEAKYDLSLAYEAIKDIDNALKLWNELYLVNKSYKDVEKKLNIYSELSVDDKYKEYIIAKSEDFKNIATKILATMNFKVLEIMDFGKIVYVVGIPQNTQALITTKKENNFFVFIRDSQTEILLDDVQSMRDKMIKNNCSKMHIIYPGNFTPDIIDFANSRQINLINKQTLLALLKGTYI
ncbi:MAG: tetratricopeptide repeat protein [Spirochaetes bacterium]|nr:tetratricopeptide repeat protein [Spirochaetota bacterium]